MVKKPEDRIIFGPINMPKHGMQTFHIGFAGIKYFVWNSYFHKELETAAKNWEAAKVEAYKVVCDYCKSIRLPAPPRPF